MVHIVYVRILFNNYIIFHGSFCSLIYFNMKYWSHSRVYFLNPLSFIYTHFPGDFVSLMALSAICKFMLPNLYL